MILLLVETDSAISMYLHILTANSLKTLTQTTRQKIEGHCLLLKDFVEKSNSVVCVHF